MRNTKILFTGGGTGGHLFPIIAIAREIRRLSDNNPKIQLHYIGPKDEKARFLLSHEGFKIHDIVSGKIRRYFSFQNFIDVGFKIPLGFLQSFFLMFFIWPDLVFSKGGSGSLVVALSARIWGRTIFLHESDTVPGKSNQVVYPWAEKVFISFPRTEYFDLQKTILTGNPILKELLEGNKQSAKEIFNLTFEKPLLLFWGGSQGAQPINDFLLSVLVRFLEKYEILHICGKRNYQSVSQEAKIILEGQENLQRRYHLWEFLDETPLKHALAATDFVISRSGSGSIFEIAASGKPAILVPLPSSAGNHQSKNAYEYAKNGAALIIEQDNLSPNFFLHKLDYFFSNPDELERMKKNALEFSKPWAAKEIAREILEYLKLY